ncbi:MAG: SPOR domain-containing protein [Cyanobacteria bacterium P01_A01_bin.37]
MVDRSGLDRNEVVSHHAPSEAQSPKQLPVSDNPHESIDVTDWTTPQLHPVLHVAMGSLDVDLEEELALYRCHVVTQYYAQQASLLDDPAIDDEHSLVAIAPMISSDLLAEPSESLTVVSSGSDSLESEHQAIAIHTIHNEAPDSYLESSEALLRSLDELDDDQYQLSPQPSPDSPRSGFFPSLMTPLGIGSLMLLILSSATLSYVVANPSILGFADRNNPDNPVAFGDSSPSTRSGIAPDLSSGEFDELDLNSLSAIPRQRQTSILDAPLNDVLNDPLATNETTSVDGTEANALTTAPATPSQIQPLAPQRFASAPAPQPAPAATPPQTSAAPPPVIVATPQTSTQSTSGATPLPPVQPPSSSPATPESAPVVATATTEQPQEGFVYVVAPFTGDRSLEQAQAAVSGAYVRNFPQGAQVQFGAFSTPERAQNLVQQLNNQGIPAQVYSR